MRTNSPIDDPVPYDIPKVAPPPPEPAKQEDDWQKLAKSPRLPQIEFYLEARKVYFQSFLPSGQPITSLSTEEAGLWWKAAAVIIEEIDNIQNTINNQKEPGWNTKTTKKTSSTSPQV